MEGSDQPHGSVDSINSRQEDSNFDKALANFNHHSILEVKDEGSSFQSLGLISKNE